MRQTVSERKLPRPSPIKALARVFAVSQMLVASLLLSALFLTSGAHAADPAPRSAAINNTEADMHMETARSRPPVSGDMPDEAVLSSHASDGLLGLPQTPPEEPATIIKPGKPASPAARKRNAPSAVREVPEADEGNMADIPAGPVPPTLAKDPSQTTFPPMQSIDPNEQSGRTPWVAVVYELNESETNNAFIANALGGAHQAYEELRTPFVETRITKSADREAVLGGMAKKGYKLIIAIGYQLVPTIISLAEKYPETRFTLIDGMVPPLFNNVQSVMFKDHEGAFLVGMLAAYTTRSKHVGFIGGMDVPVIRNFAVGYSQGVHFVDSSAQIQNGFVGSAGDSPDAWSNPDKAEKIAREMYRNGVDVIFAAAGSSGVGVLRAAKAMDRLAIGVDSNQNYLFPGTVLTSMVKRVDRAVYETIRAAKEGDWQPGIKYLGIKEEAMDFSVDRNNRALITQQMLDALENAKDMITRGSKVVESYQP